MKTTKEIGDYGERLAVNFLRRRGYIIKERNYRSGHYEIDVIAERWRTVAFVEVKTRTYKADTVAILPPPSSAVKRDKQRFTRQAARQYLYSHPNGKRPRMDVIEIWLLEGSNGKRPRVHRIRHLKGVY